MPDIFFTEFAVYVLECKTHERRVELVDALKKLLPSHIDEVDSNVTAKIVKTAMQDKTKHVRELAWNMMAILRESRRDLRNLIEETLKTTAHNDSYVDPAEAATRPALNGVLPHLILV